MKICTKCKIEKPFEAFHRNKGTPDGYRACCIECLNLRRLELKKNPLMQLQKQIRKSVLLENKLLKRENKKLCTRCKEVFLIDDLISGYVCKKCNVEKYSEHYKKNKEKIRGNKREYLKEYNEKNKEKLRKYNKEYNEKNKEKLREKLRKYNKEYYEKKKLEMQNNT